MKIAIFTLITLATLSAAQRPINYQPPSINNETANSQFTVYGTITSVTPLSTAIDGSSGNDTSNSTPNNPSFAVVSVKCTVIGQSPSSNNINVFGFGYYNSYCFSTPTIGFTGFFFLNQTDPAGNSSYILADHCNSPFDNSTENLNALSSLPNASSCSNTLTSSSTHTTGSVTGNVTESVSTTATTVTNGNSNNSSTPNPSSSGTAQVFQAGLWSSIVAIIAGAVMLI